MLALEITLTSQHLIGIAVCLTRSVRDKKGLRYTCGSFVVRRDLKYRSLNVLKMPVITGD